MREVRGKTVRDGGMGGWILGRGRGDEGGGTGETGVEGLSL